MARGLSRAKRRVLSELGGIQPASPKDLAAKLWPRSDRGDAAQAVAAEILLRKMKKGGLVMSTDLGYMLTAAGMDLRDRLFP